MLQKVIREEKELFRRLEAVRSLGKIGPAAVPALSELLQSETAQIRVEAAGALARLGPAAKDAIPALTKAFRDREATAAAGGALANIGADAVPTIAGFLKDKDYTVRARGAMILKRMGRPSLCFRSWNAFSRTIRASSG